MSKVDFRKLEPDAVDFLAGRGERVGADDTLVGVSLSQAISLKRIADVLASVGEGRVPANLGVNLYNELNYYAVQLARQMGDAFKTGGGR